MLKVFSCSDAQISPNLILPQSDADTSLDRFFASIFVKRLWTWCWKFYNHKQPKGCVFAKLLSDTSCYPAVVFDMLHKYIKGNDAE